MSRRTAVGGDAFVWRAATANGPFNDHTTCLSAFGTAPKAGPRRAGRSATVCTRTHVVKTIIGAPPKTASETCFIHRAHECAALPHLASRSAAPNIRALRTHTGSGRQVGIPPMPLADVSAVGSKRIGQPLGYKPSTNRSSNTPASSGESYGARGATAVCGALRRGVVWTCDANLKRFRVWAEERREQTINIYI